MEVAGEMTDQASSLKRMKTDEVPSPKKVKIDEANRVKADEVSSHEGVKADQALKTKIDEVSLPKGNESLFQGLESKVSLTFDAHSSEDGIQSSQLNHQPVNLWYGRDVSDAGRDEADGLEPSGMLYPSIPTGRGTTVAILDSGINISHNTFDSDDTKISKHSQSFVGGGYDDILGHGTQCAGILCGSQDNIQMTTGDIIPFKGIATDAKVMVCKVVEDGTEGANFEAVCNAIDRIMEHNQDCAEEDRVNVISLSFGTPGFEHTLTKKIQEALYNDIIIVCAASNSGKKTRQPITYPARLGHVLCIGACSANGKPTDFSPVGRELDFLAQGEDIWAPTVGNDNAYCSIFGTSFSAPLVAGIVCQVIEDLRRLSVVTGNPRVLSSMHNVWCMRELLKEMATVQGKHSDKSGYGSLNPKDYFEKDDTEKIRIIGNILHH